MDKSQEIQAGITASQGYDLRALAERVKELESEVADLKHYMHRHGEPSV
jgi:polyhydroxyalkanoate synthesis regulator phasin